GSSLLRRHSNNGVAEFNVGMLEIKYLFGRPACSEQKQALNSLKVQQMRDHQINHRVAKNHRAKPLCFWYLLAQDSPPIVLRRRCPDSSRYLVEPHVMYGPDEVGQGIPTG